MLNLDTHILVASLAGALTDRERTLVANEDLNISDIVLWELAKLVELGRLVKNYLLAVAPTVGSTNRR